MDGFDLANFVEATPWLFAAWWLSNSFAKFREDLKSDLYRWARGEGPGDG